VESDVGAWLVNGIRETTISVFYWSSRNREVDFVLAKGRKVVPIEVKSTGRPVGLPGIEAFSSEFDVHKKLLVGGQGIPVGEFLDTPPSEWF